MKTMICRNELFAYIWSYMQPLKKNRLKSKNYEDKTNNLFTFNFSFFIFSNI